MSNGGFEGGSLSSGGKVLRVINKKANYVIENESTNLVLFHLGFCCSLIDGLHEFLGQKPLLKCRINYKLRTKNRNSHPFRLSQPECKLCIVWRRHIQMNCRINAEQKCKQATVEQAPSAAPSGISDPGWGDTSLQGCKGCDGCAIAGKKYSAKRIRAMLAT